MVQLQNAIGHGQADPAAFALGGEIQIENLLPDFVGNAASFIGDAQDGVPLVLFQNHPQAAPFRHGLGPILNDIERGLLEQVGIDVCHQWIGRK